MIFVSLFYMFFKIGLFTFGGGYAMIPLIISETVKAGFLTENELIDFIAISESTPGPFAVNISTYVGMKTAGFVGALCSTMGVILPSFVIILLVVKFYDAFKEQKAVKGVMYGLKPCVVGLIAAAVISVSKTVFLKDGALLLNNVAFYVSAVTFVGMLILAIKKVNPILIIIFSGIIGIAAGYIFNL